MGFFYFDESIHSGGDFALGAFVYCEESLDTVVKDALSESGLTPYIEEFKSSSRMDQSPTQKKARELLKKLVREKCRVGVILAPFAPRRVLGIEAFRGLAKILSTTKFRSESHEVFFDQGMLDYPREIIKGEASAVSAVQRCNFHFEQDSREVLGLQIADLVAYSCAMMLLAELGIITKTVKAGQNSGYDPDTDIGVDFELWAGIRWNFFAADPPPIDTRESQLDWRADVSSRGLYVADSCNPEVKNAALKRFGSMYLGCIH